METEYIEKQAAISEILGQPPEAHYPTWYAEQIKAIPPADVVSWAYLERYAEWFCADVSFPEFIREAKAFLKASGGFQEGNEIYD